MVAIKNYAKHLVATLWANGYRPIDPVKALRAEMREGDLSCMHTVKQAYSKKTIRVLLELGHDKEHSTEDGRTPLQITIITKHNYLVKYAQKIKQA